MRRIYRDQHRSFIDPRGDSHTCGYPSTGYRDSAAGPDRYTWGYYPTDLTDSESNGWGYHPTCSFPGPDFKRCRPPKGRAGRRGVTGPTGGP